MFSPLKRRLLVAALFSAGEHKIEYSSSSMIAINTGAGRGRKGTFLPPLSSTSTVEEKNHGTIPWNLLCSKEGRRPQVGPSPRSAIFPLRGSLNLKHLFISHVLRAAQQSPPARGCKQT